MAGSSAGLIQAIRLRLIEIRKLNYDFRKSLQEKPLQRGGAEGEGEIGNGEAIA